MHAMVLQTKALEPSDVIQKESISQMVGILALHLIHRLLHDHGSR
jgi:hypothetical protein